MLNTLHPSQLQEIARRTRISFFRRMHRAIYTGALTMLALIFTSHDLMLSVVCSLSMALLAAGMIYSLRFRYHLARVRARY
ncbi:hypothetical protein [Deinococcus roseus]|uniref:DUF202 domain-containing protein n=1 Tax=Deinococcus roseus TaxID=392414 RepID=A0ABQ2D0W2_9DEIO|nr:hypothetical protein [Deinococcus roseus]GGJ40318.1 hypothetical protein GCM10008938_27970 [Deinococcus roseus]